MADTEIIDDEVKANEEVQDTELGDGTAAETPDAKANWDLQRQIADMERANAKRARDEADHVQEAYDEAHGRIGELEQELAQLRTANEAKQTRLQDEQQKLEDMDPNLVDAKVISNIQRLEKLQRDQEAVFQRERTALLEKVKELSEKTASYEQERAAAAEEARRSAVREKVLSTVESSLQAMGVSGPEKFRSEALKLADDQVDSGKVKQPQDAFEAVKLMQDCYLQVRGKHDKVKKHVSVDTGRSGVSVPGKPLRKTGSLDEVAADMLKDTSWLKDD